MSRKKGNMYAQGSTPMYTTGAHTSSCIETGDIKEETQKQHYRLKSTAINHGPLIQNNGYYGNLYWGRKALLYD